MTNSIPTLPDGHHSYAGRRVCVTGGAGFIGSHLVDALRELGADVAVLDDFSNGRVENLGDTSSIRLVRGSILDPDALADALDGATTVFHQAALGSVPASVEDPVSYQQANADGTLAVLEHCRAHRIERVVYAASSSAYGDQPASPKVEAMVPDPLSPYAASKLAGEHLLRTYAHCYGISGVSLRYFNIFGPRQRADSPYAAVNPRFADALRAGEKPVIFGTGEQTRDFTFVANAVWANLLAGCVTSPLRGESLNIACGEAISLLDLLSEMSGALGTSADARFEPVRAGDVMHSKADISAARRVLGFEPIVGFADGLRQTLEPQAITDR